jgi:predicted ATPase
MVRNAEGARVTYPNESGGERVGPIANRGAARLSPSFRPSAAAIVTIEEIGNGVAFHEHVARAFDGAKVAVQESQDGRFIVTMKMAGMRRSLSASELSDGTLRYICLLAALLSPRSAPLLVLNEPETSLHPDLLAALVDPIVATAERSLFVLTHAHAFADAIVTRTRASRIELRRVAAGRQTIRRIRSPHASGVRGESRVRNDALRTPRPFRRQ